MEYVVEGGFSCDKASKAEFVTSTTAYWGEAAPQWDVTWYGVDAVKDSTGTITDFTVEELGKESDQSRLDLAMSATNGDRTVWYVYELKERWGKYTSDCYGCEGQEGWIYNIEKDSVLRIAMEKGYIPIYVNLYPDGVIRIWDISKIGKDDMGYVEKNIKERQVVKGSPKKLQARYTLMNNQGVTYRRIWARGRK